MSNQTEKIKDYFRKWRRNNQDKIRSYTQKWSEKKREYDKGYYAQNKTRILARNKKYRIANRGKINSSIRVGKRAYSRLRSKNDPSYRCSRNLRHRISKALNGISKSQHTMSLLGCTIEELWVHLARKFQLGMTRFNYGRVWHVDHIIPCARFDLTDQAQQIACFHYSNLQPLFATQNHIKSSL